MLLLLHYIAKITRFFHSHLGNVGLDLDPSKWLPIEEVASRWSKFEELKSIDPDMTLDNWFDFHVTKSKTLDRFLAASRR
jgi:hypothetical protein